MRAPKNKTEEMILVFDDVICQLGTEQNDCAHEERWGVLQAGINKLNESRAWLLRHFIDQISDEFLSSPNYRD